MKNDSAIYIKSNSRFNGLRIDDVLAKLQDRPFTLVGTLNKRDWYAQKPKTGYYSACVAVNSDGIIKEGKWLSGITGEEYLKRLQDRKIARQAKRREVMAQPVDVKVGDVFVSNWGYDQTNIDYVAVVEVLGGRRVRVRDVTGMPGFNRGETKTKIVQGSSDYLYITCDFTSAHKSTLEEAQAYREREDVFYTGHYR